MVYKRISGTVRTPGHWVGAWIKPSKLRGQEAPSTSTPPHVDTTLTLELDSPVSLLYTMWKFSGIE